MKKTMSVVLALLMLLTMLPISSITSLAATEVADGMLLQEGGISANETVTVEITEGYITLLEFTPTVSGVYMFESHSDIDTYGYLYDSEYNQITSNDDGSNGYNFLIEYELTAGTTYYYGARYYNSSYSGSFEVTLLESPIASVEVEPITLIENTNGYWDKRYNYQISGLEPYYHYHVWTEDFNFTVTLKDGTVLTSDYNGDVQIGDSYYSLDCSISQSNNPFTLGKNELNASLLGVETTAVVEIVECPVASVEFEPVTLIENADGWWEEDYNYETGEYEDYFYYYYDSNYTVTMKDGTVLTPNASIKYLGQYYNLEYDVDQKNKPFELGLNERTVSIMGYETTETIEIIESPVASVEIEPVLFIENSKGDWRSTYNSETDEYETYYAYNLYNVDWNYTVTLKDGRVLAPNDDGMIPYNGDWYEVVFKGDPWDYQDENPFVLGENKMPVSVLGYETDAIIEVLDTPIVSIEITPYRTIENTEGYWSTRYNSETGEDEPYYYYQFWNIDWEYTVTLIDGTVLESDYNGEILYDGYWYDLEVSVNQSETPLTVGTHEIDVSILGYETTATFEIIECPIESVEIEPIAKIENTDGDWNYIYDPDSEPIKFFYYEIWGSDFEYTATLKDGTVLTSEYGSVEYDGREYYLDLDLAQYSNPLKLGENTCEATIMGYPVTVTIEILECPVASVDIEPGLILENYNGYWNGRYNEETGENEEYFYYWLSTNDFDYTVTLKDGTVLTSDYYGWVVYNDESYGLDFQIDQSETPLVLGENTINVSILGYETTAILEITDTPIASVEIEPIVKMENTNGQWEERYNEETGNYEDFYYYSSWYFDWEYTVTLKDGTVLESDYDGEIEYNNRWYELSLSIDQYETPLVVGENEVTVSILGYETTAIIEITESPVASIEVKPITFIENSNGYWDTSWYDDEEYYYYELYGNDFEYTVTLKDGTVLNSNYGYVNYNGEEYYLKIHTSQEMNHFTLGENEIEVSVLGGSTTAIVEIIESPVASIEVKPLTYIEHTNGWWEEEYNEETDEWEPLYYSYYVSSHNFDITVNLKDGTSLKANGGYVEYKGTEYYIETSTNQYENPFTLGKNQVTVSVMGCDTIAIVEIIESPVDRIESEPVTITEYTNGKWTYTWNSDLALSEYYYRYDAENIVNFKVVLKDGTVLTPYTDNWGDTYIQYMGAEYGVSLSTDQYSNHWSVGTHTIEIETLGTTGTAEIKIVSENNCPYGYDEIDGGVVITGVNDTSAERVEIPEEINGKAVVGIASLGTPYATEIIVPDSVKFLSKTWLYNCVSATSVTLGKSVQQLSADMFATAYSLESINISAENPNFKSIDGVAYTKDGSTLVAFPLGKGDTYTVPAGVSNIDVIFENSVYRDLNITFADDSDGFVTVDGVTYNSDMTTVIYCNPSKTGAYTMPDTVTEIYERAFAESGIESVKISKNVNEIVYGAFADCSSLQSVEIPNSVQSIGKQAFANCDALENITLPESLTSIGDSAFEDSDALTEISIPGGVTELGENNFTSCDSLRKATIGNGIEVIGYMMFADCVALEDVNLPNTLIEIDFGAFNSCERLTAITLPEGLKFIEPGSFHSTGLIEVNIPDTVEFLGTAFAGCKDLKTVKLPSDIKEISASCFVECFSLTSIVIPDGVEAIGDWAFSDCTSLSTVVIPDSIEYVGYGAFENTLYEKNEANYENGILYIGKVLYTAKPKISGDVIVKAGTKYITEYAFAGSKISSITLPEGLELVEYGTFAGCDNLASVVLPSTIKMLNGYAFNDCDRLESIVLPEGLKKIGDGVFTDCDNLTTVVFPEGLEYIGYEAFRDCSNLTSVTFPSTLKVIHTCAFAGCSKLSNVEFPEGLEVIGYEAFYGTAIESIKIPSTVTDIVYGAFADSNITDIDMPDSVISMDGNTLSGTPWHETQDEGVVYAENVLYGYKGTMPENTTITVKEGTLSIAGYAFDSETNLTGITFADTVGLIGNSAFYRCKGLETVTLPASVKTIESEAFAYCSSLENISLGGVKDIGYGAFRGCSSLTSIYIPASVEEISVSAFAGCSSLAEINVDADNKYYSSIDGILYNKEGTEVIYCPTAKTGVITLGLDVERVADYAFSTSKATKIIVENTATEIGEYAFATANGAYRGEINAILLCAASGSTTEVYAESSGQPFEVKGEAVLTDGETEITIEKEDNSAFENIVLNVDLLSMVEDEIVYDITLTNNGVEVQPDGAVIVKIPVPATMEPDQIKVYHLSENGNYTNMNAEYIDGYMVFTTDHFSQYVLTTEEKVTVLLGDVNGDGKLSAIDARWTLQYSAGNREFTAEQIAAADANGDGKVSAIDARWILQASAGNRVL